MNGYDVSYFTSVDSARNASELLNHKVFLSVGHDEYWSAEQRINVEAARDAGVSLAFWGGNDVFWKTEWAPSIDFLGNIIPYGNNLQRDTDRRAKSIGDLDWDLGRSNSARRC